MKNNHFSFILLLVISLLGNEILYSQCSGVTINIVPPGNNVPTLVANAAPGTCFYFPNGNYAFGNAIPKDNMSFIGESRQGVQINGSGQENAFHGKANAVTFKNMTFFNFDSKGGAPGNAQEQAPIRGTIGIWLSDAGNMATNWVIDNVECHNNLASGITIGDFFTVTNSIFRDNGVTGISGDEFIGGLIKGNTVYGNGNNGASGSLVNSGGIKLTKAGDYAYPVVIDGNTVYDNYKSGIWGDIACHGWEIINNNVYDHPNAGIVYEVSDGAYIAYNTLTNNCANWSNLTTNWASGGIKIGESKDVIVEYNTITGSRAGVVAAQTKRPWDAFEAGYFPQFPDITLVLENVEVRYNTIIGSLESGIGNAASGIGLITNPSSIKFICNNYDNPSGMTFYAVDNVVQNWNQWQAGGMDLCSGIDNDNDGTFSDADPDDNNPCVPSNIVAACDTDNDGVPDGNDQCPGVNDNLIGTACNDNDQCTENDVYNNNCNCAGTYKDSDGDGVCDAQDSTPYPNICQLGSPPILDGVGNEWGSIDSILLQTVVSGTIDNNADLSAYYKAVWDNSYLYIFGHITDDNLVNDSQNQVYKDDVLEVYIDGGNEKTTTYGLNDHQLMFRVNDPTVHYWSNGTIDPVGVDFARQNTVSGYTIEIRIAWSFIGTQPVNLANLGIDIHAVDDDNGGEPDTKITWSSTSDLAWQNTALFGSMSLSSNCTVVCPQAGTPCNDNDPNTINDVTDGFCNCAGTPIGIPNSGICQFDSPPVLDGMDTEWTADSIFNLTKVVGGTVANPADLSAEFKLAWDDNYLYFFGKITDDILFKDNVPPYQYNDDCVELFIDAGNEKGTTYDGNDFQLLFRYNDPIAYNYSGGVNNPPGVDFIMVPTNVGYNIEVRVSWVFLGVPPMMNGSKMGIDIHVNDDDDGGTREKFIAWSDDQNIAWQNPSVFGELLFEDCQSVFITPDICLWMEGVYDQGTNQMTTLLNQRNLLPLSQPYNTPPWNYPGQEVVNSLTPQSVDWVKVSFRTTPSKASEVLATVALLQEDGCLIFPDPDFFPESIGSSFYVVVEHRNHIGVMSPTAIAVNQGYLTFDFRSGDSYAPGGQGQTQMAPGVWAMFAGDGDQLQDLNGYDINGIDNSSWLPQNGGFNVYGYGDYNLDGDVSGMDKVLWSRNNGVFSTLDR